ncbi:MAG: hypothetical protein ACK5MN_11640 [Lachnospiraceae bacterium]
MNKENASCKEQKSPLEDVLQLTKLQYQYLLEYENLLTEHKKIGLRELGRRVQVSAATLSRFFNYCVVEGILTDKFDLTPYGRLLLDRYRERRRRIAKWLERKGLTHEHAYEQAAQILEYCSEETVSVFSKLGEFCLACELLEQERETVKTFDGSHLCSYLAPGEYSVSFTFYRENDQLPGRISMANNGFVHPARLVCKKRGGYLELNIVTMQAVSRSSKEEMSGRVQSMHYEEGHRMKVMRITDDKVRVPLSIVEVTYIQKSGLLRGSVPITISCSLGDVHMPESTALLVFDVFNT